MIVGRIVTTSCRFVAVGKKVRLNYVNTCQNRCFSLQSSVESLAKSQSGLFRSISESFPVECFQNLVLTVHDSTGLPWWATIVCTTVALRTIITLPLAAYQQYVLAKYENLHLIMPDIVKELKRETAIAVNMFNWDERTTKYHYNRALRKQWNNLIVQENCHPFKAGVLLLFQVPTWVCFSVSLRNLVYMLPVRDAAAEVTFLELSLGGFAWIPSLAAPDPTFILPVILGLTNLTIIELQSLSKVRVPSKTMKIATNLFRGCSVMMIPLSACVPSCLSLYWATSSVCGLMQNLILMSPKVKRFCRIPQTASELERPYWHVLQGLKYKIGLVKTDSKS